MLKITLYVGLNDKDTKQQEIGTLEAYKVAMHIITAHADGGTIFEANGFYKHNDGTITVEKSLKIELVDVTEAAARAIVEQLKAALNQESIIVQRDQITSEMV